MRSRGGGGITFTEADSPYASFYFYHPTFYVDPAATSLTFDYVLEVGPDNEDYLVVVIDYGDYVFEAGGYDDSLDDFLILSGSGSIDLTPFRGSVIDLAFGFEASDMGLDSIGTFSNLALNSAAAAPVPEPATLMLLGAGLLGMTAAGRKKTANHS